MKIPAGFEIEFQTDECIVLRKKADEDFGKSELVEDLLHFFEMREGEHISDVDIEGMMDKAALRIEELESRELGYIQSLRELEARVRELEAESAELKEKSVKKDRVTKTTLSPDDYKIIKNDIEFEIRYHIEANNPMNLEFCVENILNRCSIYSGDK